jgi:hypothetical protein
MRERFVVLSIGSRNIAEAQRSGVRHREDTLKRLDFGNALVGVHYRLNIQHEQGNRQTERHRHVVPARTSCTRRVSPFPASMVGVELKEERSTPYLPAESKNFLI